MQEVQKFSYRVSGTPLLTNVQLKDINIELRTALWNII
jgi:hypothetical protein